MQPSPAPPSAKPEPPPPPPIPAEPTSQNVPTTAAGKQLAWLLDIIVQHHGEIDRAAVVLAKNSGLPVDKATFPYVGFKGGSEPGVVDLTYLLERADDRWFVVSASFNAAEGRALEHDKVFGVVAGVIDALGKQAK